MLRELAVLLGAFRPPGEPMRRIGVLMYLAADDAEGQARLAAFAQARSFGIPAVASNLDEVLAALKNCLCTGCRTRMSA